MANKIVKVPVSEIDGLRSDGAYIFRYRIKSKDNSRKSEWSEPQKLNFPNNWYGATSSAYELYFSGEGNRPNIANSSDEDPHPTSAYAVSDVSGGIQTGYINSEITYAEDDSQIYTYKWTVPAESKINKTFDVYLSWKNNSGSWGNWQYAGTTTGDSFAFSKPVTNYQYVQAAVFLSSNPKFTNIYKTGAEITFVSISPLYSTYYDASGTVGTLTGTGPYRATITNLANLPSTANCKGRRVFDTDDTGGGSLGDGPVTVVSTSGTSMVVTSPNPFTAGAVVDVRL